MANIMLTDKCNLNCRYCFANEFVNKDANEISIDNFKKAADFILGDHSRRQIGLIGGEPTLHSRFEMLLSLLISDERVEKIILYTNGLQLMKYPDLVTHPKMGFLINCNSPTDIGDNKYDQLIENLDWLIKKRMIKNTVTLGINLYESKQDYKYMLKLLERYDMEHVRMSVTVPNISAERNTDAVQYFLSMKPLVKNFIHDLAQKGIVPNYDCNKIPGCVMKPVSRDIYKKYQENRLIQEELKKSNIFDDFVRCAPVIDICQDLTAVRCFGLSEYTKQKIELFNSISELDAFYKRTVDSHIFNTACGSNCVGCSMRKLAKCSGGCLAFKIDQILKLQNYSEQMINEIK